MNCNELRDQYELYAFGVADEPERSEIREHLNRECEVCMEGMRRAREVAALQHPIVITSILHESEIVQEIRGRLGLPNPLITLADLTLTAQPS